MRERTVRSALRSETRETASGSLPVRITRRLGKSLRMRSSTMVPRGRATLSPLRPRRSPTKACSSRVTMMLGSVKMGEVKFSQRSRSGLWLRKLMSWQRPALAAARLSSQVRTGSNSMRRPTRWATSCTRSAPMPSCRPWSLMRSKGSQSGSTHIFTDCTWSR